MTMTLNTTLSSPRKAGRLSMLALALSLSAGTVAGLVGITSLASAPAMAQSNGGGGNGGNAGGGGGNGGGEHGSPMAVGPASYAIQQQPKTPRANRARLTRMPLIHSCNGAAESIDTKACKFTQPTMKRIVTMQAFERCGLVQRIPGVNGSPAEFYCLQPL